LRTMLQYTAPVLSELVLGYLRRSLLRTLLSVLNSGLEVMMILTLIGIKYGTTSRPLEWPANAAGVMIVVLLCLVLGVSSVFVVIGWHATVSERAQEIGILKVLGASSAYILNWLFQEALCIAIPATTVGIAMTYATKWLIMYALSDFLLQETVYRWWPIAGAISLASALLGAYLGARKSLKHDVIQALSYEETASLV
jgi:ABC-type antimicrobial peptide transport system permease subunit